jgi:hypothetical protein
MQNFWRELCEGVSVIVAVGIVIVAFVAIGFAIAGC